MDLRERQNKRGIFKLHSMRQSERVFSHASSAESLAGAGMFKVDSTVDIYTEPERPFRRFLNRLTPVSILNKFRGDHEDPRRGLGTLSGVLIPTCENMWGVLIFLRFFYIVGNAGVWQSFIIVIVSFLCAILTTMSLSAIATNGPIEEGGTYYLISRALGPKLGGSVGFMYYLGVALLAVLESLGAVEMIIFTFPALDFPASNRVIGAVILVILGTLVFFGIKFVSKLSLLFFAIVLYTMGSYYLGLFLAPRGDVPQSITGLSWNTFKGNWNSGYQDGVTFSVAVSVFFPCFTGILSGADRAKNLKQPGKSIPTGTVGAVVISLLIYLSYMGLWAAVGTRDYLLGITTNSGAPGQVHSSGNSDGSENLSVVTDVGFPLAILTQLGIIIASISQALQCLITSPRLLQAIAGDGVIPFLARLSKGSQTGEPRAALLVTTVLCVLAAMIGSLDAVAPLVSICFLTCYSALNLSCVVLSMLKAPSWRPKWKYYHWSFALVGFFLNFAMNFVIKWYWAIVAVVVLVLIYVYIDYRQVEVDWGTGLGGLRLQLAVQSIMSVGHEARYNVNWRPQLLCLCKPRAARAPDDHDNYEFLSFVSHLKKGRGLCVVAAILEGKLDEMAPQVEAERVELENSMQSAGVSAFARILVAPTYKDGKTYAIQSSGLGGLEPNTLVMGWPTKWNEESHVDSAEVMLEILTECKAVNKAVLLCMNLNDFPTAGVQQEGVIDIWWIVHDGGLLLILAHLLKLHKTWRKCKLRVHTVAEKLHDSLEVKRNLIKLLDQVRIKAEVQVLELDDTGLAPYTFDYTIRLEEARAFAEEVAQYRLANERKLAQEQQKITELTKQGSLKLSQREPTMSKSRSGEHRTLENIFKDVVPAEGKKGGIFQHSRYNLPGKSSPRADLGALLNKPHEPIDPLSPGGVATGRIAEMLDNENKSSAHFKPTSGRYASNRLTPELKKVELGKPEVNSPRAVEQTSTPTKGSGRTGENILKKSVPGELSMLEGAPHQPRLRSGPVNFHQLKQESEDEKHVKEKQLHSSRTTGGGGVQEGKEADETEIKISTQDSVALNSSVLNVQAKQKQDKESTGDSGTRTPEAGDTSVSGTASPTSFARSSHSSEAGDSSIETKSTDLDNSEPGPQKETRWADEIEHHVNDDPVVEIVVEEMEGNPPNKKEEEEAASRGMVRLGSAGQLYPGSPHHSELVTQEFPEPMNRTWETFSQNYSPKTLNEIIFEQSKDAQLVLLNLPDHYKGMESARYMEYCEELTQGLRRVLLVHGTGKELWTSGI